MGFECNKIIYTSSYIYNQTKYTIMKTTYTNTIERGILTSAYKREIRENIANSKRVTLSKMKSIIDRHHEKVQSQTGTILQVSLFAFALILIIA